ncbi:MAG: QueT transporter family protein, partial [Erysipelotrichaceae bacterium]|nr:QueT transporter family protein [Erysipelotrichaceae bacterium]
IYLLRKQKIYITLLPGVIANAILVGLELTIFINLPFFATALYVGAGQGIVIYALGIPLYYALKKIGFKNDYENV